MFGWGKQSTTTYTRTFKSVAALKKALKGLKDTPSNRTAYNIAVDKIYQDGEVTMAWDMAKKIAKAKRLSNPAETIKSGEWTPAHAVRIHKGKLEILK